MLEDARSKLWHLHIRTCRSTLLDSWAGHVIHLQLKEQHCVLCTTALDDQGQRERGRTLPTRVRHVLDSACHFPVSAVGLRPRDKTFHSRFCSICTKAALSETVHAYVVTVILLGFDDRYYELCSGTKRTKLDCLL